MALVNTNTALFDNNNLASVEGVTILSTGGHQPAERGLNMLNVARTHRSKLNSAFYVKRVVPVRIGITRANRDLAEQSLDAVLNLIQGLEKQLTVRQSGGLRNFTSTYAGLEFIQELSSYLELNLLFECSERFGYDTALTTLLQVTGFTSGAKTDLINVGGSAPTQVPLLTYTLTSVTDGTAKVVTIGNGETGQAVSILRTWLSGDVIRIDTRNDSVQVNGIDVAFTGAIPEWETGVGYVVYADQFSARTFSGLVVYNKRYA